MDWDTWKEFYFKICKEFNFSYEKDKQARDILEKYVVIPITIIEKLIHNKKIVVCGAGPSLETKLHKLKHDEMIIASDGATIPLLENDIVPDIIVTDLDGKIDDIINAEKMGSKVIVHAHGDNIAEIEKYCNEFIFMAGTTQVEPKELVINVGGFTDGDRAVYLAEHFKAEQISMIGMDFGIKIGKYSFTKNRDVKIKKLRWASFLIDHLKEKSSIPIIKR